jgi:hypothetical protein
VIKSGFYFAHNLHCLSLLPGSESNPLDRKLTRRGMENNMNCMDNSPTRRFLLEAAGAGRAKMCDGTAQSRNQNPVAVVEPE